MEIKNQDIMATISILLAIIGNIEVWFGKGAPSFVVIILSVLMTGGYGAVRIVKFDERPAFNVKGLARLIIMVLMVFMAWGQWRIDEKFGWELIIIILGGLGVNATSLFKSVKLNK